MKRVTITPEDEYLHPPLKDPLWREGYYFNGYDPKSKTGISVKMEIRPVHGFRQEFVSVHGENTFLFLNAQKITDISAGSLKGEPVLPLKKWRITMKDTFKKVVDGTPSALSKNVEFDLIFESDLPPCGYTTAEGIRYEQPGSLEGDLAIEGNSVQFTGKSIRDHSWGLRDASTWGTFYMLMGWYRLNPLNFALMQGDDTTGVIGWVRTTDYDEIRTITIDPRYSDDVIQECTITVGTAQDQIKMKSQLLSFLTFTREVKGRTLKTTEMLVELENGYAFFWHGVTE